MRATGVIPHPTGWHGRARLHRFFVREVFTSQPMQGNQLGVFVDGRPFGPEQMQRLAREMNIAETVFVLPPNAGGDVSVRIFTPEERCPSPATPCSARRSWSGRRFRPTW